MRGSARKPATRSKSTVISSKSETRTGEGKSVSGGLSRKAGGSELKRSREGKSVSGGLSKKAGGSELKKSSMGTDKMVPKVVIRRMSEVLAVAEKPARRRLAEQFEDASPSRSRGKPKFVVVKSIR